MLTPELEREIRQELEISNWSMEHHKAQALVAEIDRLRQVVQLAEEAFDEILNYGKKAHNDWIEDSENTHSFAYHLGLSAAAASNALEKMRGEK
jgi:hypothetical protein